MLDQTVKRCIAINESWIHIILLDSSHSKSIWCCHVGTNHLIKIDLFLRFPLAVFSLRCQWGGCVSVMVARCPCKSYQMSTWPKASKSLKCGSIKDVCWCWFSMSGRDFIHQTITKGLTKYFKTAFMSPDYSCVALLLRVQKRGRKEF